MPKSIVLGANGYLGRHLTRDLLSRGHHVIGLGLESTSLDGLVHYYSVNCTDKEALKHIDFNVDYVFVFAGLTGTQVGFSQYERFVQINDLVLLNVIDTVRHVKNPAHIVFPSTRLVYRGQKRKLLQEDAEKEARTIYAQNKLSCEAYLAMYANAFDLKYTVFRICVPYGNLFSTEYSYGTIGFFLKMAAAKNNITLYGDGEIMRTFTHVEDISNVMLDTIEHPLSENETFNIGSNDNLSLLNVAQIIAKKYDVEIETRDWPEDALRIESGDTIFDDEKIRKVTDFKYSHNFQDWVSSIR